MKGDVFIWGLSCVAYSDVVLSLLELPLDAASCLLTQVKYTQGGLENLELSRKYFAQALRLNNRNMRALFGLYMVSTALRGEKVG